MRTDRQTFVTKVIEPFRNFVNARKNTHLSSGNTGVWTGLILSSVCYKGQWIDLLYEVENTCYKKIVILLNLKRNTDSSLWINIQNVHQF
jgi:hypothetical protein